MDFGVNFGGCGLYTLDFDRSRLYREMEMEDGQSAKNLIFPQVGIENDSHSSHSLYGKSLHLDKGGKRRTHCITRSDNNNLLLDFLSFFRQKVCNTPFPFSPQHNFEQVGK